MNACLPAFSALAGRRLHLGVCGSVAAYKSVELMRMLQKRGVGVSVTLTEAAKRFITPLAFASLGADRVDTRMFGEDSDFPFSHLLPGQCAHAFVIAPATAATLARLASGMADDLLAAQVLAFDGPVVLAPAMNPRMWQNAATRDNVEILRQRGCIFVAPGSGRVACGDEGQGKLAEPLEIALAAAKALLPQDMTGKTVLLTLGPTQEAWDGVRVWTNLSTGRMGAALAYAAYLRGAGVEAVAGPGVPALPENVRRHNVTSARQMFAEAQRLWPHADFGVFTAAVADFAPEPFGAAKFKKADAADDLSISFQKNPDILASLAAQASPAQKILGFAAETENLEESTREKGRRKKASLMAGNLVGVPDSGFAGEANRLFVCDAYGREEHWPVMSKADAAWRLLDWLLSP